MANIELEKTYAVWSEDWHYEIGPDKDCFCCLQIRYYKGKETKSKKIMTFGKHEAALIAKALADLSSGE